jgi:predicted RNA-binding protein with PUA-like domain
MKKGDYAFFYHSNCKVPGVVGMMEIVQEHTPDGSSPTRVILLSLMIT